MNKIAVIVGTLFTGILMYTGWQSKSQIGSLLIILLGTVLFVGLTYLLISKTFHSIKVGEEALIFSALRKDGEIQKVAIDSHFLGYVIVNPIYVLRERVELTISNTNSDSIHIQCDPTDVLDPDDKKKLPTLTLVCEEFSIAFVVCFNTIIEYFIFKETLNKETGKYHNVKHRNLYLNGQGRVRYHEIPDNKQKINMKKVHTYFQIRQDTSQSVIEHLAELIKDKIQPLIELLTQGVNYHTAQNFKTDWLFLPPANDPDPDKRQLRKELVVDDFVQMVQFMCDDENLPVKIINASNTRGFVPLHEADKALIFGTLQKAELAKQKQIEIQTATLEAEYINALATGLGVDGEDVKTKLWLFNAVKNFEIQKELAQKTNPASTFVLGNNPESGIPSEVALAQKTDTTKK
jgi:hypothetical protein